MTDDFGPDRYAPRFRRSPKRENDLNQARTNKIGGKITEPGRLELPLVQPPDSRAGADKNSVNASLNALLRRVAPISEIDRIICDLENVRDMLRNEGERIQREIAGYASLNYAAATAMKVISGSLRR